jgi:hypothetical protein
MERGKPRPTPPRRPLYARGVAEPLPEEPRASCFHPYAWWHFVNASWLLDQQMYAASVLIAQTAVEMGARFAFRQLLHRRHGPLDDAMERELGPPDYSFMEEGTRRLWTDLTGGDSLTRPRNETWRRYQAHVVFRNRIAHGSTWGDSNGGQDARASVLAVNGFMLRLSSTLEPFDAESS